MRGYGARQSSLSFDGVEHLLDIVQDVFVSETEEEPSQLFEVCLSVVVIQALLVAIMDGAVQFNDQPGLLAGEVCEIAVDGVLASEFHPA